jgi:hypothetical protein
MGYKVVVECEACGKDFRIKARPSRRHNEHVPDEDVYVSLCFNLMTEKQRLAVDGNLVDSEIYLETVCEPCRKALREAAKTAIKRLKSMQRRMKAV